MKTKSKNNSKHKPKPTLPKQGKFKYDWVAERQEFFESNHLEVKAFFISKYGYFNKTMSHNSVGWPKEKRQWRIEQSQLALQNLKQDRANRITENLDKLLTIGIREIENMMATGKVNIKSWVRIWEVLRTEGGLPKAISRNLNENTEIDLATARQSLIEKVNKAIPKK